MRVVLSTVITVFWAAMMGVLLQREILPGVRTDQGFQSATPTQLRPSNTQMGIYLGNRKIGAVSTRIAPAKDGSVNIINVMNLETELLRGPTTAVRLTIHLDPEHNLSNFRMDVQWPMGQTSVVGRAIGNQMEVTTVIGEREIRHVIPYDRQAMVSSSISPLTAIPQLAPGKRWLLKVWNPLTMQAEHVTVEVKERTHLLWMGRQEDVYRLEIAYANLTCNAWVTPDGELLQEEVPLGMITLTLKKEEASPKQ